MPEPEELKRRSDWFERYVSRLDQTEGRAPVLDGRFACPCCGRPSLSAPAEYDICPICFWEDDGQDDPNAAEVWGGPNRDYSLAEARENFRKHGTMYRPSDRKRFEQQTTPDRTAFKRRLDAIYSRLATTEGEATRKGLWREEDRVRSNR